jgi:hypothetical protein
LPDHGPSADHYTRHDEHQGDRAQRRETDVLSLAVVPLRGNLL